MPADSAGFVGMARRAAALCLLVALSGCRTLSSTSTPPGLDAAQKTYVAMSTQPDPVIEAQHAEGLRTLMGWLTHQPDLAHARATLTRQGVRLDSDDLADPGLRFQLAESVSTRKLERRHTRTGIGVPLVAWRRNDRSGRWDEFRPPEGIYVPATAVLLLEADGWILKLLSPLAHEQVGVGGRMFPLAADFSAAFALLLAEQGTSQLGRTGFFGMFNPEGVTRTEKLYLMKGYDPTKIPLLTVHGLQSTPLTFANLANDLFADPDFRRRYQLWQYHYPTGMAVLHNATQLRKAVRETMAQVDPEGDDFATRHIVVMGHSMGGVISHTLVSNSGDALWDSVVDAPPETLTQCPPEAIAALRDNLVFERNPHVIRAIFIAAPHRGSQMSDNWIGTLGQRLFHRDQKALAPYRPLLDCAAGHLDRRFASLLVEGKFSSIRTLSSQSKPVMALSAIPPAVPFNSIIGQEKPGPKESGSDGVVPYTSSHLEGAESELIVPYGHSAFRHPDAVREILRILHGIKP